MPVKSVIDVEVNDQAFKEFHELFGKYRKALGETGEAWNDVAGVQKGLQTSFEAVAAALMAQADLARKVADNEKESKNEARGTALAWREITSSARNFAGHISSATKNMLRWVGIGSLFGGILGGGGLFGLDRLASSVSGTRRGAMGTGTTYGERRAYEVNFGRVVNPDQFLSGVNESLHDVTKRGALYGAGLSEADMRGKDTAQVGEMVLDKWRNIAKNTPQEMLAQVLQGRQGSQFFSLEDLQRMRATPDDEWQKMHGNYNRDKTSMNVANPSAWQDFMNAMSRAGDKIEAVFVNRLTPLIPSMTKLTDAFADLVKRVMDSDTLKHWIDELAEGLKDFTGYITSAKFKSDMQDFASGVEHVAEAMIRAMRFLGLIPEPAGAPAGGGAFGSWRMGGAGGGLPDPWNPPDPWNNPDPRLGPRGSNAAQDKAINDYGNESFEKNLALVKRLEGSKPGEVSRAGAVGSFQIMPDTAKLYDSSLIGLSKDQITERLKDPIYNESVARKILHDLDRREHGDFTKELIGYNAGPGRADQYEASGRDPGVLPAETQRYLINAARIAGQQRTVVDVRNNTGGSTIISSSTLPQ